MTPVLTGAVALPDGTPVRGRGRRQELPPGPLPDFGLHLGRLKRRERPPTWPTEWIDWPDFRTPRDDRAATARIRAAYERARAGERVEIACAGARPDGHRDRVHGGPRRAPGGRCGGLDQRPLPRPCGGDPGPEALGAEVPGSVGLSATRVVHNLVHIRR
jgi:hypothetical protein